MSRGLPCKLRNKCWRTNVILRAMSPRRSIVRSAYGRVAENDAPARATSNLPALSLVAKGGKNGAVRCGRGRPLSTATQKGETTALDNSKEQA